MVATRPIVAGALIARRYRVLDVLGEGGMAVVYRAKHEGTGRLCALKVVRPHLVEQSDVIRLFLNEARIGGTIGSNPHIIDVLDADIDPELGIPFMTTELLEGETLAEYLKRGQPMPWRVAVTIFEQLRDALEQAHAANVVHRDLKPSNLFLTYDRRRNPALKILDFGIAKVLEAQEHTATQVGTPVYAAPEQLGPRVRELAAQQGIVIAKRVSTATDIWALGLLAYELLCGLPPGHYWTTRSMYELPFEVAMGNMPAASWRAGDRARFLPPGFDDWFARCLRRNAEERWRSAREALSGLTSILAGWDQTDVAAPPPVRVRVRQGLNATVDDPARAAHLLHARAPLRAPQRQDNPARIVLWFLVFSVVGFLIVALLHYLKMF
jgi:serine/threonine-protein kinase